MNRAEFMEQLKKRLHKLPFDETREAVEYYEQYFDDAGEENEQAVIAELGSPSNVASQIIADFAVKDSENTEKPTKKGLTTVWLVILAVFASPIALPIAVAVVAVALTVVIVILSVIFSIGVTGTALLLGGIISAVMSVPLIVQSLPTTLFFFGFGLVSIGLGIAILIGTVSLSKKSFNWLAKLMGKFILRRSGK